MSKLDFSEFQREHGIWADSVFGKNRTPEEPLKHLASEVEEIIADPTDLKEYVDAFLLLMDCSRLAGFDMDDIYFGAKEKFETNKVRNWVLNDKGFYEHVK